jgi:hypothetical protein
MTRTAMIGKGCAVVAAMAVFSAPGLGSAQEAAQPGAPAHPKPKEGKDKPEKAEKEKVDLGFVGTALGAYDSNILDKGTGAVGAAGLDVTLGLTVGVPVSKVLSWASGVGLGSNYRDGISGNVGGANALRLDAHVKTGIEALLAGKSSLPGRHVKHDVFPVVKLAVEAKYALWANPYLPQPPQAADETEDALEPTEDDDAASGDSGGGGGEAALHRRGRPSLMFAEGVEGADSAEAAGPEAGGEEAEEEQPEAAEIPIGGQTFSNPNTHHKFTGVVRLTVEPVKKLTLGVDGGVGRDLVNLDDSVEVSPEYNEVTAGASAKYKISPKLLWVSLGYIFERRIFDEVGKTDLPQDFSVQGAKVRIDVPLKPVKFNLTYDIRFKLSDTSDVAGGSGNTTRHQFQLGAEIPIMKILAAVVETRLTDTQFSPAVGGVAGPDSVRFIGLAGLKVSLH